MANPFRSDSPPTMTGPSSWRSLRSVMLATAHVAAVAYVIRTFGSPSTLLGSLIWVPATIAVGLFGSWPIGQAIARAFDPGEGRVNPTCPRCGRLEVRPLIRPGAGLFQAVTSYRCAACWSTFRDVDGTRIEEPGRSRDEPVDPSGIAYLSDPPSEGEIVFLDEPTQPQNG